MTDRHPIPLLADPSTLKPGELIPLIWHLQHTLSEALRGYSNCPIALDDCACGKRPRLSRVWNPRVERFRWFAHCDHCQGAAPIRDSESEAIKTANRSNAQRRKRGATG